MIHTLYCRINNSGRRWTVEGTFILALIGGWCLPGQRGSRGTVTEVADNLDFPLSIFYSRLSATISYSHQGLTNDQESSFYSEGPVIDLHSRLRPQLWDPGPYRDKLIKYNFEHYVESVPSYHNFNSNYIIMIQECFKAQIIKL